MLTTLTTEAGEEDTSKSKTGDPAQTDVPCFIQPNSFSPRLDTTRHDVETTTGPAVISGWPSSGESTSTTTSVEDQSPKHNSRACTSKLLDGDSQRSDLRYPSCCCATSKHQVARSPPRRRARPFAKTPKSKQTSTHIPSPGFAMADLRGPTPDFQAATVLHCSIRAPPVR